MINYRRRTTTDKITNHSSRKTSSMQSCQFHFTQQSSVLVIMYQF